MKGYITLSLGRIIEMVLVIVVIALILFVTAPQVSGWINQYIFNPLTGKGVPLGTPEAVTLEAAIKCSYLRCFDGCGKGSVQSIDIGTKNCDADFCVPYKDANGKVCGDNSKSHPVVVTLLQSQALDKSKIKKGGLGDCITTADSCDAWKINGWVTVEKGATTEKQWEEQNCRKIFGVGISGYSKILIKQNKYNVWTTSDYGTAVCIAK